MIITPLSALVTSTKNPPTRTEYPCLRNFWKCEEATGAASLVDAIAGNNVVAAITRTADGFGVDFTATGAVVSGTMGTLSTPFIFMCVGSFNGATAGPFFQDGTTGASLDLTKTGGAISQAGAPVPAILTAFTQDATTRGRAIAVTTFNNATGMTQVQVDTVATMTATAKDISGGQTSIPMTTAGGTTLTYAAAAAALYGMAIFTFATTVPANYQAAIAWMAHQWSRGNKVIYPGWKGLS